MRGVASEPRGETAVRPRPSRGVGRIWPLDSDMVRFPQEIVDMIIDKLAKRSSPSTEYVRVSTTSRRRLHRTHKYHFEHLRFRDKDNLEKWRGNQPGPITC